MSYLNSLPFFRLQPELTYEHHSTLDMINLKFSFSTNKFPLPSFGAF